jgi:hypothetical protein
MPKILRIPLYMSKESKWSETLPGLIHIRKHLKRLYMRLEIFSYIYAGSRATGSVAHLEWDEALPFEQEPDQQSHSRCAEM